MIFNFIPSQIKPMIKIPILIVVMFSIIVNLKDITLYPLARPEVVSTMARPKTSVATPALNDLDWRIDWKNLSMVRKPMQMFLIFNMRQLFLKVKFLAS